MNDLGQKNLKKTFQEWIYEEKKLEPKRKAYKEKVFRSFAQEEV